MCDVKLVLEVEVAVRSILLAVVATLPAAGQIVDLAPTGDGAEIYFATSLPRKETGEPAQGRIYRVANRGVELFAARVREDPVRYGPPYSGAGYSNYFALSRPEVSRDGTVVAFTGARNCVGGYSCFTVSQPSFEATVQGVPGKGEIHAVGMGRLSGNGRYLLLSTNESIGAMPATVLDLETGETWGAPLTTVATSASGRVVADDGTAVFTQGGRELYVTRKGQVQHLVSASGSWGSQIASTENAVIDAAARVVLYDAISLVTWWRVLRIYRLAEQRDALFLGGNGDTYQPAIAADGRRVMFLSTAQFGTQDPPGTPQLYVVNTDGTGFRRVTFEPGGVLRAVMSDNGRVAWYVSGAGRLVKLDLETGQTEQRTGRTPVFGIGGTPWVAGSAVTLLGEGFSDWVYTADTTPLPRELGGVQVKVNGLPAPLLAVEPTQILFQLPWETPAPATVSTEVVTTATDSPFEWNLQLDRVIDKAVPTFVMADSAYGRLAGESIPVAVHEHWDALVTPDDPARPGEVIHLYGTGFGRVAPTVATGMPAPSDPLARTVTPVTCSTYTPDSSPLDVPVLYAGLAPGLVGFYQLSVRIPAGVRLGDFFMRCEGEGDGSGFYGWLPMRP